MPIAFHQCQHRSDSRDHIQIMKSDRSIPHSYPCRSFVMIAATCGQPLTHYLQYISGKDHLNL